MNETGEAFLDQHLPRPGIVAAAIRGPASGLVVRRDGNALTTAQVEQLVAGLLVAADKLERHQAGAARLCWTFEHARLHFLRRSDGAVLVLFVDRENDRARQAMVEDLLGAFGT